MSPSSAREKMSTTQQEQRPMPKLGTLVHCEIPATDAAKVSNFYSQLFGWKFNKWEVSEMPYWLIQHKDATHENDTMGRLFIRQAPNHQFVKYYSVNSVEDYTKQATSA